MSPVQNTQLPYSQDGFTLIEIIVVVFIFAILSLMAYGGLRSVLDAQADIEASLDRTAAMQRAFMRMRNDFQNTRFLSPRGNYGDSEASFYIDQDDALHLVRGGRRSALQISRPSLERVSYRLDENTLKRSSWQVLDLAQDSEPVELALLENIEGLKPRFLDASGKWHETWPAGGLLSSTGSGAKEAPPVAVEIVLETEDWGEMRFLFRTPMAALARNGSGTSNAPAPAGNGFVSGAGGGLGLLDGDGLISGALVGVVAPGQAPGTGASGDADADNLEAQPSGQSGADAIQNGDSSLGIMP